MCKIGNENKIEPNNIRRQAWETARKRLKQRNLRKKYEENNK